MHRRCLGIGESSLGSRMVRQKSHLSQGAELKFVVQGTPLRNLVARAQGLTRQHEGG